MNIEAWSAFCGRIEANLRTPHNVTATPSPAESLPPPPPPRNVTPNISQNQKRIQCLADAFVCVSKLVVAQAAQIRVRFRIQSRIRFLLAVHLAEMCGKKPDQKSDHEIGYRFRGNWMHGVFRCCAIKIGCVPSGICWTRGNALRSVHLQAN